ncbi:MAG: beta-glucanase [Mucilaginibacter sp. 44-25]|nr:MAG: beta-glucanase [Mucilaginibacter sp. 44-25]
MKILKNILTTIFFINCINMTITKAQDKGSNGSYELVWSDEFDKDGAPDTANWQFEKGFVRNHELQWYQPENAYCKDGKLIIEARNEHVLNPGYLAESTDWRTNRKYIDYTSASLNTAHAKKWLYGRMVMRARIDTAAGLWPAFWTLGEKGQWPSNGEIDIMEYYRGKLLANIACGTNTAYKAKWYSNTTPIKNLKGKNWSKHFHTWRMDWDSTAISLFVDDSLLNRVELKDLVNQDGTEINPFKQPHYILVNLALGGDNGGNPSHTTFPRKYEIDYIRVYQKKD